MAAAPEPAKSPAGIRPTRVAYKALLAFGEAMLAKLGASKETARVVSRDAVATEALGVRTHGLRQFTYIDGQIPPDIDPKASPVLLKELPATALIDGQRCFSQLCMGMARQIAVDKARRCGAAVVAVRNTCWLGALNVYLLDIAREGYFAQLWAQWSPQKQVAPYGGIDARMNTNPVAFAFPTGGEPMVSDFSTGATSMGRTGEFVRTGLRPADPPYIDRDGNLTADPAAFRQGGAVLPAGRMAEGYKGFALSMYCEALGALAGTPCGVDQNIQTKQGFNLTVIDPDAFAGRDQCTAEIERYVAWVKTSRLIPGFTEIRLPGERAARALKTAMAEGLLLEDWQVEALDKLALKHGLAPVART